MMASSSSVNQKFEPPYPDVFGNSCRDDNLKFKVLTSKWDLAHKYSFPSRYQAGCFRKLNSKWLTENGWLRYSVSKDGVYRGPCYLLGSANDKTKILVSTPLTDWSNITKVIAGPKKSPVYDGALVAAENFVAILSGKQKDILSSMSSSYNALVERNRQILVSIVETVILCGKQNIAFRGHTEADSNFKALLEYQAKHNSVLREHLDHGDPSTKYTSPDIQNEIIGICSDIIVKDIVAACNNAPCFGFIADEATDVATMEQMALCVRYYDETSQSLKEDFLGFAESQSTTGEALSTAFLDNLRRMNIQMDKMRGQGYDGAANMSGRAKGVQARIKELFPGALYTHCRAHSLNLAIIHASKEAYPRNMMDMVQTIAFAFNYSAKRMLCFREHLADNPISKEEMERRNKLKSLCETRWAARADALYTFLACFDVVVDALEELSNGDSKAAAYRQGILSFEFIVTLVAIEHVLSGLVSLSTMLQRVSCDLLQASLEANVVVAQLEAERNDVDVWNTLFEKATDLAQRVDVDVTVPRRINRQQNRPNAPADTASDFWRRNMYLPFVDHILSEMQTRLLQAHSPTRGRTR